MDISLVTTPHTSLEGDIMIAIGNGEKCPYCDKVMKNFKIDGQDSMKHFINKHPKEFEDAIFKNIGGNI